MEDIKTTHISELDIPEITDLKIEEFDEHKSSLDFEDPRVVRDILMQHFLNGERIIFFEILGLYMNHVGKTKISREAKIPERTIYNFIKGQHQTSSANIFKIMKFISNEVEKKSQRNP